MDALFGASKTLFTAIIKLGRARIFCNITMIVFGWKKKVIHTPMMAWGWVNKWWDHFIFGWTIPLRPISWLVKVLTSQLWKYVVLHMLGKITNVTCMDKRRHWGCKFSSGFWCRIRKPHLFDEVLGFPGGAAGCSLLPFSSLFLLQLMFVLSGYINVPGLQRRGHMLPQPSVNHYHKTG